MFLIFKHILISRTSQLTTHERYIFSIYGIRMPSQHSKPARIHGNTISKFIRRHHHDRNISIFGKIIKNISFSFFSTQHGT